MLRCAPCFTLGAIVSNRAIYECYDFGQRRRNYAEGTFDKTRLGVYIMRHFKGCECATKRAPSRMAHRALI